MFRLLLFPPYHLLRSTAPSPNQLSAESRRHWLRMLFALCNSWLPLQDQYEPEDYRPKNARRAKSGLAAEPLSRERSRYKSPFSAGPAAGQRRNPLRRRFKWPYTPRMTAKSRVTLGGRPVGDLGDPGRTRSRWRAGGAPRRAAPATPGGPGRPAGLLPSLPGAGARCRPGGAHSLHMDLNDPAVPGPNHAGA